MALSFLPIDRRRFLSLGSAAGAVAACGAASSFAHAMAGTPDLILVNGTIITQDPGRQRACDPEWPDPSRWGGRGNPIPDRTARSRD